MQIDYRALQDGEISCDLFAHFIRHQVVNDCWRKVDEQWVIKADPFIDDWSAEDYQFLVACLKNTIRTKGLVYACPCT